MRDLTDLMELDDRELAMLAQIGDRNLSLWVESLLYQVKSLRRAYNYHTAVIEIGHEMFGGMSNYSAERCEMCDHFVEHETGKITCDKWELEIKDCFRGCSEHKPREW